MKQKHLSVTIDSRRYNFSFFLKAIFNLAVFLTIAGLANAQHCDGCTVNINGPEYVNVGDIITYTCTPSYPQLNPSTVWDDLNFLDGFGEIIDHGVYSTGEAWATVRFYQHGSSWFNFSAGYQCCAGSDYDEIYIWIQ
jgi:hypothetical protein